MTPRSQNCRPTRTKARRHADPARIKANRLAALAVAAVLAGGSSAQATDVPSPDALGITAPSIATSLPNHGDPWGARQRLAQQGITYNAIYTNDVLSNLSGGQRRGTIDQGKLELQLTVDLEKFAGWQGWSFYANAFQIHNTGRIRRDYVGGLNTIAAIEAAATTRLSEAWLEKKLFDGHASLRFGQLAADSEFFFSDLSTMFLQSDWPTIAAVNLPGGGPAYPLSTPGVRLKLEPNEHVAMLFAVFNGDPAGPCAGDPDTCNRYGLNFRVHDPALAIAELQVRLNQDKTPTSLPTTLKFGGWRYFGSVKDQHFDQGGLALPNPASNGVPMSHRGNFGIYGVVDQMLYRAGTGPDSGISVFGRASVSPSDRNLIDLQMDGGLVFAGLLPQRPDDKFGVSAIYSRFSDSVRNLDRDLVLYTGHLDPPRDYEANLEISYMAQIVPGWTVQPDFQYVWHPSGVTGRNAKVMGVRTMLKF